MTRYSANHEAIENAFYEVSTGDITSRDDIHEALIKNGIARLPGNFVKFVEYKLQKNDWQIYAGEVAGKDAYMIFWLSPDCKKSTAAAYCSERGVNADNLFLYDTHMGIAQYSRGRRLRAVKKTLPAADQIVRRDWDAEQETPHRDSIYPERLTNPTPAQAACQDLMDYFFQLRDWAQGKTNDTPVQSA